MAQVIEQERSIQTAIRKFRKLIEDNSYEHQVLEWAFPNGEKDNLTTYKLKTSYGILGVGIPDRQWNNRTPHLFTLSMDASVISPDVEINIPLTLNRNVSGVYVKNGKDIWLCSRGDFTAYRGKIKRDITFSYFDKWLIDITDGEKSAKVIPIAALTSPNIANQIANFVASVNELKERYKSSGNIVSVPVSPRWNKKYEFEGEKTKNSSESETKYEYLHGPICNELQRYLETVTSKTKSSVAKNMNIDVAIIKNKNARAIFEVKTSISLSEQLYKGVGQLLCYRNHYGETDTVLFLVIPYSTGAPIKKLNALMQDLGIHLVIGKESDFMMQNKDKLNDFLINEKIV